MKQENFLFVSQLENTKKGRAKKVSSKQSLNETILYFCSQLFRLQKQYGVNV